MDLSIIIPTCNRSHALYRAITSLSKMNQKSDVHEIIIIDNGSTDDTRKVVEEAASRWATLCIRYFYEPIPGLLSARHRGVLESKGKLCAFLDDDVEVGNEWLNGLEDAFQDPAVVLVGGPSWPVFERSPPEWLDTFYHDGEWGRACGWLSLFDGGEHVKQIHPTYVWGLNFIIRRGTLFDLGGFHPDSLCKPLQRFQGDGESGLACAVASAGLKTLYHPRVVAHHGIPASRLTIDYFEQRAFFQGVCDSFSEIRANSHGCLGKRLQKAAVRSMRRVLRHISDGRSGNKVVKRKSTRAYDAGYTFHQREVTHDPKLLDWVMRKDYWDYRLPNGWESFLPNARSPQVIS